MKEVYHVDVIPQPSPPPPAELHSLNTPFDVNINIQQKDDQMDSSYNNSRRHLAREIKRKGVNYFY